MRSLYILLFMISFNASAQVPAYNVIINPGAPGGYYFVDPLFYSTAHNSYNIILDSAGNVVWYQPNYGSDSYGFTLQPNGLTSYFSTGMLRFVLEDSAFNVTGNITPQGHYNTDVHELQILPNGHYLLLAQEYVTMDLSSYNYFSNNNSPGSSSASVICAIIQELDTNLNVVFEWHAKDYLPFDSVDPFFLSSPTLVDWTHSNAVTLDTDGNILLSSRNLDEITKINRQDSSIIWRFGGKYNMFTMTGDTVPFYGQHDIRSLSNGHYTLFDDGNHTTPHGARALEYQLNDSSMTAQLVWSYTYDSTMYCSALGSVQRLLNSNTLIDYGELLSNNICFNVVDSVGAELFRLTFNSGLPSYRAFNYPQLPWRLNRPQISCFEFNDTLYLAADSGYSSYQWNNGSTTRSIAVTTPDTFSVFVPYGQGFISSQNTIVTDLNGFCSATSVSEVKPDNNINIFPNPVKKELTIENSQFTINHLSIYNILGQVCMQSEIVNPKSEIVVDVSSLAEGFYILNINGEAFKFIKN